MATPAQGAMFAALKGRMATYSLTPHLPRRLTPAGRPICHKPPTKTLFKNGPNKNELLKLLEFLRGLFG